MRVGTVLGRFPQHSGHRHRAAVPAGGDADAAVPEPRPVHVRLRLADRGRKHVREPHVRGVAARHAHGAPGALDRLKHPSAVTRTAKSLRDSPARAVTRAWVQLCAPEQYCFRPFSTQPAPCRTAVSPSPGGSAAHTPHRSPRPGGGAPSSARIAVASTCPSTRRAVLSPASATVRRAANRSAVRPEPGSGKWLPPASMRATASAKPRAAAATSSGAPGSARHRSGPLGADEHVGHGWSHLHLRSVPVPARSGGHGWRLHPVPLSPGVKRPGRESGARAGAAGAAGDPPGTAGARVVAAQRLGPSGWWSWVPPGTVASQYSPAASAGTSASIHSTTVASRTSSNSASDQDPGRAGTA